MSKHKVQTTILEWVFIISISIVAVMLAAYSFSEFYPAPDYNAYCGEIGSKIVNTEKECVDIGGKWNPTTPEVQAPTPAPPNDLQITKPVDAPTSLGYCNSTFTCQAKFDKDQNAYKSTLFVILTIVGLALLSASLYTKRYFILSIASSITGIISIFSGGVINWSNLNSRFKVILLVLILITLIILAIKKFESKSEK